MKKIFLLFAISILVCNMAIAQDARDRDTEEYTVFEVASGISSPVKVETDKGTYSVNSTLRLNGYVKVYSVYDSRGRKIMCDGHKGFERKSTATANYKIYTYRFETLEYVPGSNSDSNSGNYNSSNYNNSSSSGAEFGRNMAKSVGRMAEGGMHINRDCYPNVEARVAISRAYGEYFDLRCHLGGATGYLLYGGIGKDWLFNGDNKEKLAWHVGIGTYFAIDDNNTVAWGLSISETPVVENYAMMCDINYDYFWGKNKTFGVFGGLGLGAGHLKDGYFGFQEEEFGHRLGYEKIVFVWDIQVGIAVRLFR